MSNEPAHSRRIPWLPVGIVVLLGLPFLYVGSLAPVWKFSGRGGKPSLGRWYAPVFTLMEQTPLRAPLLGWCSAWDCRPEVERYLRQRELRNMMDSETQETLVK